MTTIPRSAYEVHRQIDCYGMKNAKFKKFVKHVRKALDNIPGINFDGAGARTIFLRFNYQVPKTIEQIDDCFAFNNEQANAFIQCMAEEAQKINLPNVKIHTQ